VVVHSLGLCEAWAGFIFDLWNPHQEMSHHGSDQSAH
jgi:hypothetical protein